LKNLTGTQPHTIPDRFNHRHSCARRIDLEALGRGLGRRTRARVDGTGHSAIAQIYDQTIFPNTLVRREIISAGCPSQTSIRRFSIGALRCFITPTSFHSPRLQVDGRPAGATNARGHLGTRLVSVQSQ